MPPYPFPALSLPLSPPWFTSPFSPSQPSSPSLFYPPNRPLLPTTHPKFPPHLPNPNASPLSNDPHKPLPHVFDLVVAVQEGDVRADGGMGGGVPVVG